ncbi:MAG TPA: amylo-alpha-1,6-glucosidase [Candidatus Dormibacteraeota bacterium]|nr:amylo-alpha-1,6-glucosidase [Candidatus Dormibacteraeota bacterium]
MTHDRQPELTRPLPQADVTAAAIPEAHDQYDVQADAALADELDQVLKHGDSFAVFDRFGDIRPVGLGEEGIYHLGTRHLSGFNLRVDGKRPLLLGSTAKRESTRLAVDLTNPDLETPKGRIAHATIHLSRTKVLWDGVCYERLSVRNFGREPVSFPISLRFIADFADIFEVRGMVRARRGRFLPPKAAGSEVLLRYAGLDGVVRRTRIRFSVAPDRLSDREAVFRVRLPPTRATSIDVTISCESGARHVRPLALEAAVERARGQLPSILEGGARISTSNALFNEWVDRSAADLAMLTTETPQGPFPYAGVPWFSTPFGRDGLITALQRLWCDPGLARGVLDYLATHQAAEADQSHDAEPGKILHEVRNGEMAALGEVPFGRYYGSHDATPLFVMLAAAYWRRTGDDATAARLWPNIERALHWMETDGDPDGDGFLDYRRRTSRGLVQQGWKDSWDAIFHADGELAKPPIALCEIQGYMYAARIGAAELADALGHGDRAAQLRAQAQELQAQFDAAFWLEDLETYALALDGARRPCRVHASNAGHALLTGVASPARAEQLAKTLMADASFSGWGIRTAAAGEARYNPMSYHDGSVWPHDNAMIALGLARYGFHDAAIRIFSGLFDASRYFELARLPELFCGFTRRAGEGPTRYPVACSPQAWSAGSIFMLLQATLGLEVDAVEKQIRFRHARLPDFLDEVRITGLRVGEASIDMDLARQPNGVGITVLRREGTLEVVSLK